MLIQPSLLSPPLLQIRNDLPQARMWLCRSSVCNPAISRHRSSKLALQKPTLQAPPRPPPHPTSTPSSSLFPLALHLRCLPGRVSACLLPSPSGRHQGSAEIGSLSSILAAVDDQCPDPVTHWRYKMVIFEAMIPSLIISWCSGKGGMCKTTSKGQRGCKTEKKANNPSLTRRSSSPTTPAPLRLPKRRMFKNKHVSQSYLQADQGRRQPPPHLCVHKGVIKQKERMREGGCAPEGFRSQQGHHGGFVQGLVWFPQLGYFSRLNANDAPIFLIFRHLFSSGLSRKGSRALRC